ncbi:MAG: 23S rRNA (guanosine(2251)-2'-O)-methyltransferase RlmB [Mycoplasmoidaceae bacterium]
MANILVGKKAILEQLKKDNVLVVHSLTVFPEIKKICEKKNINYIVQKKAFFNNFDSNHQGVIAWIKNENYLTENFSYFLSKVKSSINKRKVIVIIDEISDTGNFGAIIRSCDAFGVDGIIIKNKNQAEINEYVIKASTGAIYNSNILRVTNLGTTIKKLKEDNFWIVSTTLNDSKNLNDTKFNFDCCLIFGNEKNGISKKLIENSDFKINIPMLGSVQSLNVSVSAGIILNYIRNFHLKE